MKKLIVSADDFGLTEGINRGIVDAFKNGIVTSASLLATTPAFDHALELAIRNTRLDVGIHVSLTVGTPCSDKKMLAPLLEGGEFIKSYRHLFKSIYMGRVTLDALSAEIGSQISKILESGLKVSHMNSHQHVLMLPCFYEIVAALMKEYAIPFFRVPAEIVPLRRLGSAKGWGLLMLGLIAMLWKRKLLQTDAYVRTSAYFWGLSFTERMSLRDLMRVLSSLKPGINELICHPGYKDDAFALIYGGPFLREQELNVLKSPEAFSSIRENDIRLVSYKEV